MSTFKLRRTSTHFLVIYIYIYIYSSMNGTSRLTFAYRPVSWRLLGFHSSGLF